MNDVEIRSARREELPAIVTLYNLMWTHSGSPIDLKVGQNIFDRMREKPDQDMYVAETGGRVVGTFMLLFKSDVAGRKAECVVENVVVHPKYQRRGIGRKMMRFATEKCKSAGCPRLVIASGERRENPGGFYESLGFRRSAYGFVRDVD